MVVTCAAVKMSEVMCPIRSTCIYNVALFAVFTEHARASTSPARLLDISRYGWLLLDVIKGAVLKVLNARRAQTVGHCATSSRSSPT